MKILNIFKLACKNSIELVNLKKFGKLTFWGFFVFTSSLEKPKEFKKLERSLEK